MVGGGWNGNLSKSNNWWQTLRSKELKKLWKFYDLLEIQSDNQSCANTPTNQRLQKRKSIID